MPRGDISKFSLYLENIFDALASFKECQWVHSPCAINLIVFPHPAVHFGRLSSISDRLLADVFIRYESFPPTVPQDLGRKVRKFREFHGVNLWCKVHPGLQVHGQTLIF
jgi:hypothetical protein